MAWSAFGFSAPGVLSPGRLVLCWVVRGHEAGSLLLVAEYHCMYVCAGDRRRGTHCKLARCATHRAWQGVYRCVAWLAGHLLVWECHVGTFWSVGWGGQHLPTPRTAPAGTDDPAKSLARSTGAARTPERHMLVSTSQSELFPAQTPQRTWGLAWPNESLPEKAGAGPRLALFCPDSSSR